MWRSCLMLVFWVWGIKLLRRGLGSWRICMRCRLLVLKMKEMWIRSWPWQKLQRHAAPSSQQPQSSPQSRKFSQPPFPPTTLTTRRPLQPPLLPPKTPSPANQNPHVPNSHPGKIASNAVSSLKALANKPPPSDNDASNNTIKTPSAAAERTQRSTASTYAANSKNPSKKPSRNSSRDKSQSPKNPPSKTLTKSSSDKNPART
mmetsp:Transcript_8249/g.10162  ORF Transcript_8249/g.10162 Transcript_8249/m.10162 type:complete len:203 (+) Transcript_8249:556-1164(+)